jgi:hypothetical protein
MKKSALVLIALLVACFAASARQISENEALLKAAAFSQKAVASRLMSTSRSSAMTLAYTQQSATSAADNCFYVFNRGTADGYVIVSADDRTDAILGYTDSGSFNYSALPSNARWWFSEYQRQIQYLIDHPNLKNRVAPKSLSTSVAPLCKSLWTQTSPFNDNCPTYTDTTTNSLEHCAAGCVATAVGQIMYYHKWPVTGIGSHSYTSRSMYGSKDLIFNLSADFSKSTYDWANMTDSYNDASTILQNQAVAKLISDVGIGCDMSYGVGSGAEQIETSSALVNFFGYDKCASLLGHNYFSISEWDALIQGELNAKRPVFYGGAREGSGHAFVLDGYNTEGYYHVNWGWNGTCNGYFRISALNPVVLGIGGGKGGYNYDQVGLFQLMKPKDASGFRFLYCLTFDSISPVNSTVSLGDIVPVKVKNITNGEYRPFSGVIGLITRDGNGNVVDVQSITGDYTSSIMPDSTSKALISLNYKVPATLSDGVYSMMVEARADGDTIWQRLRGTVGDITHFNVTVSGPSATVVNSINVTDLNAAVKSILPKLYKGRKSNITTTVANNGADYHGDINLIIYDADFNQHQTTNLVADISAGQSASFTFNPSITVPADTAHLLFTDKNGELIGDTTAVVLPTPDASVLTLTEALSFPDINNVDFHDMQLTAKIKNAGGLFSNNIKASILDADSNEVCTRKIFQIINRNESQTVTFSDGIAACIPGKSYILQLAALDDSGNCVVLQPYEFNNIKFTVKADVPSAIGSVGTSANRIFPNPASDAVTIENASAILGIKAYSVTGALVLSKPVSNQSSVTLNVASLPAGTYIVRVATSAGITVQRFVKR